MDLVITKDIALAVGIRNLQKFGMEKDAWNWRPKATLNAGTLDTKQLTALEDLLAKHTDTRGVKALIADIEAWRAAMKDSSTLKPKNLRQFETLLQQFLLKVTGHWVFARTDSDLGLDDAWLPYYVIDVEYHPEDRDRGRYYPAHVEVGLAYEVFGGTKKLGIEFRAEDVKGRTIVEALARKGYYKRTPELYQRHLADMKRFGTVSSLIGHQFLCTGVGTDDVDGNPDGRDTSWYWNRVHKIPMVRNGEPSRVVVDVFYEDPKEDDRDVNLRPWFWNGVARGRSRRADDDDDVVQDDEHGDPDFEDDEREETQIEIPIHPFMVVFDLAKHLRFRVHVHQLTEYVYDQHLADKLVLSEDRKALVRLLIESKAGGYRDIVKGKGGGSVVLLAGPPGTGKTLTAEVYAESEGRALYSVQCSQLGTDPETLEDELLKVFARARRWNAVMLLDEADVYVHERGNDLQQNAIVGVFLRVLEYQDSVLFLTTNRPDDVDDAIASRCIARLTYQLPTDDEQKRIWRVLSEATGAKLTDDVIDVIVSNSGGLSGRDVKNLLKLARVLAPDGITPEAVEFVKQFKPTSAVPNPTPAALPAGIRRCPKCGVLIGAKGHTCRKAAR